MVGDLWLISNCRLLFVKEHTFAVALCNILYFGRASEKVYSSLGKNLIIAKDRVL